MEQMMSQMMVRMLELEQRNAQMEERMVKMEEKMTISILINEKFAKIVDVQATNIQSLSSHLIKKEQQQQPEPDLEKGLKETCRICEKNEVNKNETVCPDCWKHCEPAIPLTKTGLEAIEQEFRNLRTEDEERFWRFHDKFTEQFGEYSHDTLHLFNINEKEIKKLTEKHDKIVDDIRYCINRNNNLRSNLGNTDERVGRILSVVHYLAGRIDGKEVAEAKFNYMKFNFVEPAKGSRRLTLDDLV